MSEILADGQLAASSGTLEGAGPNPRVVAVSLFNTNTAAETATLTVSRNGGTARKIFSTSLAAGESAIVSGISLGPADVLSGLATDASKVDYLVFTSRDDVLNVRVFDANGAAKSSSSALVGGKASVMVGPSAAITNSSTEALFDLGQYSIPANTLKVGSMIRINFQGIATATNSSDTLTIKAYIGGLSGTAILASSATDATNNDIFAGEIWLTVRTIGASGTFVANASFTKVEAATSVASRVDQITASTAIDTTAAQVVGISGKWSAVSASDSCRLDIFTVEIYP